MERLTHCKCRSRHCRSRQGIWYLVIERVYIHVTFQPVQVRQLGEELASSAGTCTQTASRSPWSASPSRRPTRACRDQGRTSMSEHHMSEKNDVAAKQFLTCPPRSPRKGDHSVLLITIVAAGVFAFLKLGPRRRPYLHDQGLPLQRCGPERQHRRCRISLPSR